MRVATLLHRGRSLETMPVPNIELQQGVVTLQFAPQWLEQHALTRNDLKIEQRYLKKIGITFTY